MTRSHSFVGIGFVTLALLCAAGCAGSDPTGDTDAGNNDAGPGSTPSVSSTSPVAGAAGVSLTSAFAVIFSEAMDPSTLTTSTFTVTASNGSSVAGMVTYSGVTAVFRPSAALTASTSYTASLSTGAKSQGDVALDASYSWTITTSATADTTAPTVDSTSPASAATGVSLNAGISVTFSEAMDPSTITAATFTLKLGTTAVAGAVDSVGATATFIPSAALVANSTYTATILSAKDLSGNPLAGSESFTFTTGASASAAPTVVSMSPANLATGVATNSAVVVAFSEAMSPASVSAATFKVTSPGNVAVAGSVTYSGTTATFQPASHLANSTQYTATITTGVKDLGGTALATAQVWTFTTGAAADTTPPTVTSTNPLSSATAARPSRSQALPARGSPARSPSTARPGPPASGPTLRSRSTPPSPPPSTAAPTG
jgi:methionine-rich copper-binding protein CopC